MYLCFFQAYACTGGGGGGPVFLVEKRGCQKWGFGAYIFYGWPLEKQKDINGFEGNDQNCFMGIYMNITPKTPYNI